MNDRVQGCRGEDRQGEGGVALPLDGAGESRALTGLRGLGAMLVVAHHLYLHLDIRLHVPSFEGLLKRGFIGVDLFFVLSGFVLSLAYGQWFDGSHPGRLRRVPIFLIRRVARLWPLHAAILAILLTPRLWALPLHPTPALVFANTAMVQAWGLSAAVNPPAWSVSTEFLAYILFPALAAPVLQARRGMWLGLAAVAGLLALCLAFAPPVGPIRRGTLDIYLNYSLLPCLRCLAGVVLGMLAWRVGSTASVARLFSNAWTAPLALAALVLSLGRSDTLLVFPLLPVIVLALHFGTGRACRAFAEGPLHRLGLLSYAVYLIHFEIMMRFPFDRMPLGLSLLAYLGLVLLLAAVAHAVIERPARHFVRRAGALLLSRIAPASPLQERPTLPI